MLLAEGYKTLADGQAQYNAGKKQLDDGAVALAEGKQKLDDAEKQIADGEKKLADAEKQLADGEKQLGEFEDGRDQVIDGLNSAMATEPDPGLTSVAARLGEGFSFMKNSTDLDIDKGLEVASAARGYSSDSGDLITKEITQRAVGTGIMMLAAVSALIAGLLGLGKKPRRSAVPSLITTVLGAVGTILPLIAGIYYSKQAGAPAGQIAAVAGAVLAVLGAANAIAALGSKESANV